MTTILVGPFNRVEGDLEVKLEVEAGIVQSAQVTTTLYRGFEQILQGRPPQDALVIAPRICGICSVSQSLAAAAALRHLTGLVPPPNGQLAARLVHAAENMADHLTHFYLFFMPDFARDAYASKPWFEDVASRFKAVSGQAMAQVLPARTELLHIMGLLAGKWPHSLALQPGGTTQVLDVGSRVRLGGVLQSFRKFLEQVLFAAPLDQVLSFTTLAQLQDWAESNGGDFAAFLRLAADLKLEQMGRFTGPWMSYGAYDGLFPAGLWQDGWHDLTPSEIREDVSHAWFHGDVSPPWASETLPDAHKQQGYSWAKAPRWQGQAVEVGALARQMVAGDALIADVVAQSQGSSVLGRVVARIMELAKVLVAAEKWMQDFQLHQPFCLPLGELPNGSSRGLIEAARGSLGHWMVINDNKIVKYQIIAPTTWNFSPRDENNQPGALEKALEGLEVGEMGGKAPQVQHIVRSFDPCMVCTAH